jgi:uncharacterized protein with von Willebrand factor type A (vWA) domain
MAGFCSTHFVADCIICNPRTTLTSLPSQPSVSLSGFKPKPEIIPVGVGEPLKDSSSGQVAHPNEVSGFAAEIKKAGEELALMEQAVSDLEEDIKTAEEHLKELRDKLSEVTENRNSARQKMLQILTQTTQNKEATNDAQT